MGSSSPISKSHGARAAWCVSPAIPTGFTLGARISLGYGRPDENWKPTVTSITVGDGSWAEITLADDHGVHQVTEGGPRRVWRIIEYAHALWAELGQPGWDRFGLTVTETNQQIWLDTPTSDHTWPLPLS